MLKAHIYAYTAHLFVTYDEVKASKNGKVAHLIIHFVNQLIKYNFASYT